jgi:pimeloyl-ACP methyl ester carboxylesterase
MNVGPHRSIAVPQRHTSPAPLATNEAPPTVSAPIHSVGEAMQHSRVHYRFADVQEHEVFYREAGPKDAPAILLLHGFPTSSHMFRNLIPVLAARYRVIAPDLPGFGFTVSPSPFEHTFDHLAEVMDGFTASIDVKRYAVYVFDYGAPVGFRLALEHPDRVTALITQNGNAYEEGIGQIFDPMREYWREPSAKNRSVLRELLKPESIQWQYTQGVTDTSLIAPESYALDAALIARPGNDEIQLDLFLDYRTNVALYPRFQEYFRTRRPPLLAVWGRNDLIFVPKGAEAFKRDIPSAEVFLYETGHFALETHAAEIGASIREFLNRNIAG